MSHKVYKKELEVIQYMQGMCEAWGKTLSDISSDNRKDGRPSMRRLLCMATSAKYKDVPLWLLARVAGFKDHSGVSKGMRVGHMLLTTEDQVFMKYYDMVRPFFANYTYKAKISQTVKIKLDRNGIKVGPEWIDGGTLLPPFYKNVPIKTKDGKYDTAMYMPASAAFKSPIGTYPVKETKWLKDYK